MSGDIVSGDELIGEVMKQEGIVSLAMRVLARRAIIGQERQSAARELGVGERTLRYWLRDIGVDAYEKLKEEDESERNVLLAWLGAVDVNDRETVIKEVVREKHIVVDDRLKRELEILESVIHLAVEQLCAGQPSKARQMLQEECLDRRDKRLNKSRLPASLNPFTRYKRLNENEKRRVMIRSCILSGKDPDWIKKEFTACDEELIDSLRAEPSRDWIESYMGASW